MDPRRKILILYASAGYGHEKAAKALREAWLALEPSAEVECLDTLSFLPGFFALFYEKIYYYQIKYVPWLWGLFYYSLDLRWIYFFMRGLRRAMNALVGRRLEQAICDRHPDLILTTHFMATEVSSTLKRGRKIGSKIVTVITDYMPHRVWMAPAVDFYSVGAEVTRAELMRRGVAGDKIIVHGIPADPKFSKSHDRPALRKKLGFRREAFTVLLTGGGFGIGAIQDIARGLLRSKEPLYVVLVCGKNERLFHSFQPEAVANEFLKLEAFVHNMEEWMEVSDLVIGKGGGLTVTECLCKGKPMVLFRSVPGQEARNASFITAAAAGFSIDDVEQVIAKTLKLKSDAESIHRLKQNIRKIAKPHAAENLVRWAKGIL